MKTHKRILLISMVVGSLSALSFSSYSTEKIFTHAAYDEQSTKDNSESFLIHHERYTKLNQHSSFGCSLLNSSEKEAKRNLIIKLNTNEFIGFPGESIRGVLDFGEDRLLMNGAVTKSSETKLNLSSIKDKKELKKAIAMLLSNERVKVKLLSDDDTKIFEKDLLLPQDKKGMLKIIDSCVIQK